MKHRDVIANLDKLSGRTSTPDNEINTLLDLAVGAGQGDVLEIGTLFGYTACAMALARKRAGLAGKIVCLDPLNGYYKNTETDDGLKIGRETDILTGTEITPDVVMENAKRLKVAEMIEIVAERSYPWPDVLEDRQFVMSFVDGDHWTNGPMRDWLNVKDRTRKFVVFHDYHKDLPAVRKTCTAAACDSDWAVRIVVNNLFSVERKVL